MSDNLNLRFFYNLKREGMKSVLEWCRNEGLIAAKYECPSCKNAMKLVVRKGKMDGYEWVCRKKGIGAHYNKRSAKLGSMFEKSKVNIIDIICVIYLWVFEAGTCLMKEELGMSENTIIYWKNYCRGICVDMAETEEMRIGGQNVVVELDECMFEEKNDTFEGVKRKWVFGGVVKGTNNCFFAVVDSNSAEVLLDVIKEYILPGSTIVSKCWKAYNCLSNDGYVQLTVTHSLTFKDPDSGTFTRSIENLCSVVKREFRRRRNWLCNDAFDSYLAEFMWRRKFKGDHRGFFRAFLNCLKLLYNPKTADNK